MKEPVWIRTDAVLTMHEEALMLHGGSEGLRDMSLLEPALARAKNRFHDSKRPPSLMQLATTYAKGIAANRPFIDGNKRTAFIVSVTFLYLNGVKLAANKKDRVLTFWNLADGSFSEEQLGEWFERNTTPL